MLISLLFSNPILFVLVALALVISLTIHEFAHAYASFKLGDPTANAMGRLTLNPLAHLDPIGTIMLLTLGFGWGKPVLFNPEFLRNPKRDGALIAFAGPLSNFILALLLSFAVRFFGVDSLIGLALLIVIQTNLGLGFFNLIPLHPLDGFKVVNGFLPENLSYQWMEMERYGVFILMILIFTRTTSSILGPLINIAMKFLGLSF